MYPGESFVHLGDVGGYDDDSHLEMKLRTVYGDEEPVDEQKSSIYAWVGQEDSDALGTTFEDDLNAYALRFMIDALDEFRKDTTSTSTPTEDEDPIGEKCREAVPRNVFWFSLETPDRLDDLEWQPMELLQSDIDTETLTVASNEIERDEEGEGLRQDFAWDSWGKSSMPDGDEWQPGGALHGCVDPLDSFSGL
jgi:hypothetical protein